MIGVCLVGCTHRCRSHDPCAPNCPPAYGYEPGLFDRIFHCGRRDCCPPACGCQQACPQPQCCPTGQCGHQVQGGYVPVPQASGCDCGQHVSGSVHAQPHYANSPEFQALPPYPVQGQIMGTQPSTMMPAPVENPLPAPAVEGTIEPVPDPQTGSTYWTPGTANQFSTVPSIAPPYQQAGHAIEAF